MHREAVEAVESLLQRGERVCIVLQNAIEFWSVATRPLAANGLGYSQAETQEELRKFEAFFTILPGGSRTSPLPDFYIGAHAAVGRLALLTRDRARYRSYFPAIEILAPATRKM